MVALATPSAAAAALRDSWDGTGSTATASPFGSAMTSVLKICSGSIPLRHPGELVDGLLAERLVLRVVVVRSTSCGIPAASRAAIAGVAARATGPDR